MHHDNDDDDDNDICEVLVLYVQCMHSIIFTVVASRVGGALALFLLFSLLLAEGRQVIK